MPQNQPKKQEIDPIKQQEKQMEKLRARRAEKMRAEAEDLKARVVPSKIGQNFD